MINKIQYLRKLTSIGMPWGGNLSKLFPAEDPATNAQTNQVTTKTAEQLEAERVANLTPEQRQAELDAANKLAADQQAYAQAQEEKRKKEEEEKLAIIAAEEKKIAEAAQKKLDDEAAQKKLDDAAAQAKADADAAQKKLDDAAAQAKADAEAAQKKLDEAAAAAKAEEEKKIADLIAAAKAEQKKIDDELAAKRLSELMMVGTSISNLSMQSNVSNARILINGLDYVSNKTIVHNRDAAGNIILINKV